MFKRMSVLVRRPDHDRATFSHLWQRHAAPVSRLPKIRGYIQNHVLEVLSRSAPIQADGFVELLWDRPEDMGAAFASDAARPMVEDEPGFLGHGSGYALANAQFRFEPRSEKLIVAVLGDASVVLHALADAAAATTWTCDEVASLIAKPKMQPPQPVDAFVHVWCQDDQSARNAAAALSKVSNQQASFGVYRVHPLLFV